MVANTDESVSGQGGVLEDMSLVCAAVLGVGGVEVDQ